MDEKQRYEVCVRGRLSKVYLEWLEGFAMIDNNDDQITRLTGIIIDQSHLRGLINKLFDLNLEIISLQQINNENGRGGNDD